MTEDQIALGLIMAGLKDESNIAKIVNNGIADYTKFLGNMAKDIYDSCIQVFYATYPPSKYDRHGDKKGFNLYAANCISANDFYLSIRLDSGNLLPYKSNKFNAEMILDNMMGIGKPELVGVRAYTRSGGTMDWEASYPNDYSDSRYSQYWASSKNTIGEIFDEFYDSVIEDTHGVFLKCVAKYL